MLYFTKKKTILGPAYCTDLENPIQDITAQKFSLNLKKSFIIIY